MEWSAVQLHATCLTNRRIKLTYPRPRGYKPIDCLLGSPCAAGQTVWLESRNSPNNFLRDIISSRTGDISAESK